MRYYLLVNNLDNNVDKSLPNIILYLIFNVNLTHAIFITRTNKGHGHKDYNNKIV